MGAKWSQNRRKSFSSFPVWNKKGPDVDAILTQRRSCKPQHEFLSDDEQSALIKSWEVIKSNDLQLIGIKVLTRIFQLEPQTKQTFSNFKSLSTLELLENSKFRSHAIRFMRAVEVTMENLDALDVIIIPNLKHLGQLHTDIPGFKLSYLRAVEQAMDETWDDILSGRPVVVHGYINHSPSSCLTNDPALNDSGNELKVRGQRSSSPSIGYDLLMRSAWMKVFQLITSKIMEGYHEGLQAKEAKEKMMASSQGSRPGSHSSSSKQLCSDEEHKPGESSAEGDLEEEDSQKQHGEVVTHCHGNGCDDNDINVEMKTSNDYLEDHHHHHHQHQNGLLHDCPTNNNYEKITPSGPLGNR